MAEDFPVLRRVVTDQWAQPITRTGSGQYCS